MGIWDFINSGKETVKWYTPDPVKKACNASYNYSVGAATNIDNVVRVNGLQKLGQHMPDDEGRAKIVSFSTKFVKNASVYVFKEAAHSFIPGGKAVARIYSDTVREVETECQKKQDKSCIKEITGNSGKNITNGGSLRLLESKELELGSENRAQVDPIAHQTPEDAIRVFMMKEFMGTRYLDDLLVPHHGKRGSKIVKEGLKDQSPSRSRLDKQDLTVMMEEMQAKMEKLQDDVYTTKQQNEMSVKCAGGLDSFEFSDEPIKSSAPTNSNKKKVFIRSRL